RPRARRADPAPRRRVLLRRHRDRSAHPGRPQGGGTRSDRFPRVAPSLHAPERRLRRRAGERHRRRDRHARGAPRAGWRLRGTRRARASPRGDGGRLMAEDVLHEEETLGKAYDARLARRLAKLVKPYRGYAIGSVVVLLLESVVELAGPLLTAAAIDLVL